jgi:hypothetical protein
VIMRFLPHSRRHRPEARDPLARLRRRFTLGAAVAAAVFVAAFVTGLVRHAPGDDTAVLGAEVAASGAAVLCGASAASAGMLALLRDERQGDDMSWAWHLGAKVADTYPAARLNGSAPRTPNMR